MMTTADWYVVHTKPRQERVALDQLQRQDFEVYLPLFKILKKRRGGALLRPGAAGPAPEAARAKGARRGVPTQGGGSSITTTTAPATPTAAPTAAVTHEPMFPRYLFLRPTRATQSLSVVRSTVGVSRLVLFGQQPARLAATVVDAIRAAESARETASLGQISAFKPGMPVTLLDPAFSGLQALVQSVSKDRVTLLLQILGRPQSVQVEINRVAPL